MAEIYMVNIEKSTKTMNTSSTKKPRPVADESGSAVGKARYSQIKGGIDQYKKAMKEGFYIEAIALMESAISDRLESTLNYLNPNSDYSYETIGRLANALLKANYYSEDTLNEIKIWAKTRNEAIHQMVKLLPDQSKSFQDRYDDLKHCAEEGYSLFRKVDNEKKRMIRKSSNP